MTSFLIDSIRLTTLCLDKNLSFDSAGMQCIYRLEPSLRKEVDSQVDDSLRR